MIPVPVFAFRLSQEARTSVDEEVFPLFEQDHLEVVETLLACAEPRGGLADREFAGHGLLDDGSDVGIVLTLHLMISRRIITWARFNRKRITR